MTDSESRYSLVAGEGDGAMLGVAAGDTAGGAWQAGYSAVTEQATVIAYHLIESRDLDTKAVIRGLRELDGSEEEEPVYRGESAHFRAWLGRASDERPDSGEPCLDGGPRAVPLGVAFRRRPGSLRLGSLALGRVFHADVPSVAIGVTTAAAVAASCFGQSGRDLVAGVAETLELAAADAVAGGDPEAGWAAVVEDARSLVSLIGIVDGEEALAAVTGDGEPGAWEQAKAGLVLAAPPAERVHVPIEQAARIGGSALGAMVGGMIGARVGIRAWPWAFANDTWFAEIGRRLARGPRELGDLPIPYAVEQHLISGERGFR